VPITGSVRNKPECILILCACGCGELMLDRNEYGRPRKFINGHQGKGEKNHKNHNWKGDNVKNKALHYWVRSHLPKPELCVICGIRPPTELSNISTRYNKETYNRDLKNWRYVCKKCHDTHDGISKNWLAYSVPFKKGHIPWNKGLKGVMKAWNKGIPRTDLQVALIC
jgi:hypothetical protein